MLWPAKAPVTWEVHRRDIYHVLNSQKTSCIWPFWASLYLGENWPCYNRFVPKGPIDNKPALVRLWLIWSNADPVHWRVYTALGGNELNIISALNYASVSSRQLDNHHHISLAVLRWHASMANKTVKLVESPEFHRKRKSLSYPFIISDSVICIMIPVHFSSLSGKHV